MRSAPELQIELPVVVHLSPDCPTSGESMEINKGPDWTAAQFTAGAIGFFASAAVAHLLVAQGYATRNWAVILIAIGLCVPPAIVRWLDVRKHQKNSLP